MTSSTPYCVSRHTGSKYLWSDAKDTLLCDLNEQSVWTEDTSAQIGFQPPSYVVWIWFAKMVSHVFFCYSDYQKSIRIQSGFAKYLIWAGSQNRALYFSIQWGLDGSSNSFAKSHYLSRNAKHLILWLNYFIPLRQTQNFPAEFPSFTWDKAFAGICEESGNFLHMTKTETEVEFVTQSDDQLGWHAQWLLPLADGRKDRISFINYFQKNNLEYCWGCFENCWCSCVSKWEEKWGVQQRSETFKYKMNLEGVGVKSDMASHVRWNRSQS